MMSVNKGLPNYLRCKSGPSNVVRDCHDPLNIAVSAGCFINPSESFYLFSYKFDTRDGCK